MNKTSTLVLLIVLGLLQGCASGVPAPLRGAPDKSPGVAQVRSQPTAYSGMRLRWGGTIAGVENLPDTTRIEIVARRLYRNGEPMQEDSSEGRFIAQFDHFIDPAIYQVGRAITVVGSFIRLEQKTLDQMQYHYPLLRAESHYLWPEPEPYYESYDPYWRDPFFYDPWYPFGYPYPYYHPRHYWPHHR